jgi:ribosome-binding protein aMBF1 (putative translation factor)
MSVQVIEKNGKPEWAVLPYEEYERLVEEAEMLQDVRAYDEAKKAVAAGEELVPSEVTYAILDGANPVRAWREHRGISRKRLAEASGLSASYLSQVESGKRQPSPEALAAIAKELGLEPDDIIGS